MGTAPLRTWRILRWRSRGCRFLPRSNLRMSSAGTGRSARRDIRISRRAVITHRTSPRMTTRASSIARPWISCSPNIKRFLLPRATNTSLGEIVNARTLETQVAHLLSHTHKEVRGLGESLKKAATSPAYEVNAESLKKLVDEIRAVNPELGARAERELLREVKAGPT